MKKIIIITAMLGITALISACSNVNIQNSTNADDIVKKICEENDYDYSKLQVLDCHEGDGRDLVTLENLGLNTISGSTDADLSKTWNDDDINIPKTYTSYKRDDVNTYQCTICGDTYTDENTVYGAGWQKWHDYAQE